MIGFWLETHPEARWALLGIAAWNVGVILWSVYRRRRELRELRRMLDGMKASSVVGVATTEAPGDVECRPPTCEHKWGPRSTRVDGPRVCRDCDAVEGCPCSRCDRPGGCPGPAGDVSQVPSDWEVR